MNDQERKNRLTYSEKQFALFQSYVLLDHAILISGEYKTWNTAVGVAQTPEEKASGASIEFRACTEEEKRHEAVRRMKAHLNFMSEIMEGMEQFRDK